MLGCQAIVLFLVMCFQPVASQPTASQPPPAKAEPASVDAAKRLADLEDQKKKLEAEIAKVKQEIAAKSGQGGNGADAIEKARAQLPGKKILNWEEVADAGELKVSLVSMGREERRFRAKKRLDFEDRGFVEMPIPVFCVLFRITNESQGRVIQPFPKGNMFGGRASVVAIDNWDNKLVEQNISGTELEIEPAVNSGFVIQDERLKPGETKNYLFILGEPEVEKAEYYVVNVDLATSNAGKEIKELWFFVPPSKLVFTAQKRNDKKGGNK